VLSAAVMLLVNYLAVYRVLSMLIRNSVMICLMIRKSVNSFSKFLEQNI